MSELTRGRPSCWCGGETHENYSDGYDRCTECGTLRTKTWPRNDPARVTDDEGDFYGKKYWLEHQSVDLGHPTLIDRARWDLPERCTYWLRALLKYKSPPAKILEVGCAHGASVALMRAAGFDAMGLELSPWIVDFARRTFAIPMLQGPLEDHSLEPGSFDAIAFFDVLEHVTDPSQFIQACEKLLRDDGILVIQTPRAPDDRSFTELKRAEDPFLVLLKEEEHLNLFTRNGLEAFLAKHGFSSVSEEPALFDHYDMFHVASRTPLRTIASEERTKALAHPAGRIVEGLLTLEEQGRTTERHYLEAKHNLDERGAQLDQVTDRLQSIEQEAEQRLANSNALQRLLDDANTDRSARLEANEELQRLLDDANTDRSTRLEANEELQRLLDDANADRSARLEANAELQRLLDDANADRSARLEANAELQRLLDDANADRSARLEANAELQRLLDDANADRNARLEANEELQRLLDDAKATLATATEENDALRGTISERERDLAQRARDLEKLQQRIDEARRETGRTEEVNADLRSRLTQIEAEHRAAGQKVADLGQQVSATSGTLRSLSASRVYRALALLGLVPSIAAPQAAEDDDASGREVSLRIAVDLTPLLPGGDNGGAKIMVLELLRALIRAEPGLELVLLTSDVNHDELAALESENVSRLCVLQRESGEPSEAPRIGARLRLAAHRLAGNIPPPLLRRLLAAYWSLPALRPGSKVTDAVQADLLFCPFTAPFYHNPSVPTVSVVYDLQYLYYPTFFSAEERHGRALTFQNACRNAQHLVCISDFVRSTVLEHSNLPPERVSTVHIQLAERLSESVSEQSTTPLQRLDLTPDAYLLYPANFWRHKNHRMLLTAFAMFRARNPDSQLALVCTGAPGADMQAIAGAAQAMGLASSTRFPGFLSDDDFSALLDAALALIFPSLFEGFGMPLLEAMARSVPVLCSNSTALAEVAADAALQFDCRRPVEIVEAIERIERDPDLRRDLAQRGNRRYAKFSDSSSMAAAYLEVFRRVLKQPAAPHLDGIFPDGWTAGQIKLFVGDDGDERNFEIELGLPPASPHQKVTAVLKPIGGAAERFVLRKDETITIQRRLPRGRCEVEIAIAPTFRPRDVGINDDTRELACVCHNARLSTRAGTSDLLAGQAA